MLSPEALALPSLVSVDTLPEGAALSMDTGEVLEVSEDSYPHLSLSEPSSEGAYMLLNWQDTGAPVYRVPAHLWEVLVNALNLQASKGSDPMTKPAPALSFAVCDLCGEANALPMTGAPYAAYCPACMGQMALEDAARAHLEEVLAPVLGAWGSFWMEAGLEIMPLVDVLDILSNQWEVQPPKDRAQQIFALIEAHPLPGEEEGEAPTLPDAQTIN